MNCDRHENAHQELWRIYQNKRHFSDNPLSRIVRINGVGYPYNLFDNIIEINEIPYNIQWEDKHLIIVNNNESKIDTLSLVGEIAELVIISYLACLAKEEGVE